MDDKIMYLEETAPLMVSTNYIDRFKAEYYQLKIRLDKLKAMLEKWDRGQLNFEPTCERSIYNFQVRSMEQYLEVLEFRANVENIIL